MKKENKKKKPIETKKEIFEPSYIMIDRNKLAARSQEIAIMISTNNIKDPDMKDPNIIIQNSALQGANNMIIEILDEYDSTSTKTITKQSKINRTSKFKSKSKK